MKLIESQRERDGKKTDVKLLLFAVVLCSTFFNSLHSILKCLKALHIYVPNYVRIYICWTFQQTYGLLVIHSHRKNREKSNQKSHKSHQIFNWRVEKPANKKLHNQQLNGHIHLHTTRLTASIISRVLVNDVKV